MRIDHFEKTLTISGSGVGEDGSAEIDLKTGGEAADESWITEVMRWSRPVHEHFVFDLEEITGVPIVLVSTIGMLAGMFIGVFMGWPRIQNTISGWHKATAWVLLPLLILSPLTGVFMAWRISFSAPAPRAQAAPVLDTVRMIAQKHDVSGIQSIRSRAGRQIAVVMDGGSRHVYIASREGLQPAPANWPRIFHEGTFLGIWGGVMNVILSLAFILLLATGLWIWGKRTFHKRRRIRGGPSHVAPAAAE